MRRLHRGTSDPSRPERRRGAADGRRALGVTVWGGFAVASSRLGFGGVNDLLAT